MQPILSWAYQVSPIGILGSIKSIAHSRQINLRYNSNAFVKGTAMPIAYIFWGIFIFGLVCSMPFPFTAPARPYSWAWILILIGLLGWQIFGSMVK
jgi:hypothetical protein